MHHVRRVIAVLLLIALVPTLALAAMSVRFCNNAVKHQALEFVVKGVAHSGHKATYRAATDVSGQEQAVQIVDDNGCTDISLVDSASMPPLGKMQLLPVPALQHHVSGPQLSLVPPLFSSVPIKAIRQVRTDPRISARYTIVLQI